MFAVVELGAFVILRRSSGEPASRAHYAYQDHAWAGTFWREFEASKSYAYQPYVVWRRMPFAGETIAVDEAGLRLTEGSRCDGESYTIYMFGGSTMWGTGAPNWGTIPSFLARLHQQAGRPVCVRNYGESAWVSTQEVLKLALELKQSGRRPDLVVFYDGASDIHAALQSGGRDVHQNFDRIKSQFETRRQGVDGSFGYILTTNTFQLLQQTAGRSAQRHEATRQAAVNVQELAQATVSSYLKNMDLVDGLARQYGFAYAFFWQPLLFAGQKPFTAEEERLKSDRRWLGVRELTEATSALVRQEDKSHLYNLADAFREYRGHLYVDFAHVLPEGNRLVAERMYEVLRRVGRGSG